MDRGEGKSMKGKERGRGQVGGKRGRERSAVKGKESTQVIWRSRGARVRGKRGGRKVYEKKSRGRIDGSGPQGLKT